jgi:hypothetical protein
MSLRSWSFLSDRTNVASINLSLPSEMKWWTRFSNSARINGLNTRSSTSVDRVQPRCLGYAFIGGDPDGRDVSQATPGVKVTGSLPSPVMLGLPRYS